MSVNAFGADHPSRHFSDHLSAIIPVEFTPRLTNLCQALNLAATEDYAVLTEFLPDPALPAARFYASGIITAICLGDLSSTYLLSQRLAALSATTPTETMSAIEYILQFLRTLAQRQVSLLPSYDRRFDQTRTCITLFPYSADIVELESPLLEPLSSDPLHRLCSQNPLLNRAFLPTSRLINAVRSCSIPDSIAAVYGLVPHLQNASDAAETFQYLRGLPLPSIAQSLLDWLLIELCVAYSLSYPHPAHFLQDMTYGSRTVWRVLQRLGGPNSAKIRKIQLDLRIFIDHDLRRTEEVFLFGEKNCCDFEAYFYRINRAYHSAHGTELFSSHH